MLTPEQVTMIAHLRYGFPLLPMTHDERANLQAMTVFRIKQQGVGAARLRIKAYEDAYEWAMTHGRTYAQAARQFKVGMGNFYKWCDRRRKRARS